MSVTVKTRLLAAVLALLLPMLAMLPMLPMPPRSPLSPESTLLQRLALQLVVRTCGPVVTATLMQTLVQTLVQTLTLAACLCSLQLRMARQRAKKWSQTR